MNANLLMKYEGRTVVTELQIHYRKILEYNDSAHAHDAYEFFRSLFGGAYDTDMDTMLERSICFLDEVRGVPVLLSMLVLLFKFRSEGSAEPLPADRFELYELATRLAVQQHVGASGEAVWRMLRRIAAANQRKQLRIFKTADVEDVLAGCEEEGSLWEALLKADEGVPLVKMLVDAGGGHDGEYQFRHLSFQEGLTAVSLMEEDTAELWPSKKKAAEFLKDPFNLNTCKIGGGRLGDALM
eukprot:5175829-Prymnesium_polylepis.1